MNPPYPYAQEKLVGNITIVFITPMFPMTGAANPFGIVPDVLISAAKSTQNEEMSPTTRMIEDLIKDAKAPILCWEMPELSELPNANWPDPQLLQKVAKLIFLELYTRITDARGYHPRSALIVVENLEHLNELVRAMLNTLGKPQVFESRYATAIRVGAHGSKEIEVTDLEMGECINLDANPHLTAGGTLEELAASRLRRRQVA